MLVLYAHPEVLGLYSTLHSSLITWGMCVLLSGWLVGVIIELPFATLCVVPEIGLGVARWLKKKSGGRVRQLCERLVSYEIAPLSWLRRRLEGYSLRPRGIAAELSEKERETIRREEYKTTAEKIMLRTLAALLLFSCVVPPRRFPALDWNRQYVLAAALFCLVGYLWFYILPTMLAGTETEREAKSSKKHMVEVAVRFEKAQDTTSVAEAAGLETLTKT